MTGQWTQMSIMEALVGAQRVAICLLLPGMFLRQDDIKPLVFERNNNIIAKNAHGFYFSFYAHQVESVAGTNGEITIVINLVR